MFFCVFWVCRMLYISKKITLTKNDFNVVINNGKYSHELFADFENSELSKKYTSQPFPGQYILFLAGGLAEEDENLPKDIIAMSSIENLNFYTPGLIGDRIYLKASIDSMDDKKYTYSWEIFNGENFKLLDCKVNFIRNVKK